MWGRGVEWSTSREEQHEEDSLIGCVMKTFLQRYIIVRDNTSWFVLPCVNRVTFNYPQIATASWCSQWNYPIPRELLHFKCYCLSWEKLFTPFVAHTASAWWCMCACNRLSKRNLVPQPFFFPPFLVLADQIWATRAWAITDTIRKLTLLGLL